MSPVFTCTCDELFVRALIAVFFLSAIRCLRVRSAGVSRAERCCALWQPAHRRSAWTRSTSRISAVPSARVVSEDDDFFQQAFR